jgi:hypothetical protein
MLVLTARQWRTRPSELLDIDDPYVAYCVDEACAYIAEQTDRKKKPAFPKPEKDGQAAKGGAWTTNSDLVEDLLKETKQA